jgi:phosphoribosyl 1,2-cyclic phosphodiesterase
MLRFASLGSGSAGNALIVQSGQTTVMLDCGFGLAETQKRLAKLDLTAESINAIIVTHEHSDHLGGVPRFAAKFAIPVYLSYGTYFAGNERGLMSNLKTHCVDSHSPFSIGELELHPYPVPHDAREPMQCVFSDGEHRLGVLTDVGETTPLIEQQLSGCDALFFETNHCVSLLAKSQYPMSLKHRIGGRYGHLSNDAAASIVARLDRSKLQHFICAHLSAQNNTPSLAQAAMAQALSCSEDWVGVATQDDGLAWRTIN